MSGLNAQPDLRVCADLAELSSRAAEAVAGAITDAVRASGACSLVLSGGTTPRTLYGLLASRAQAGIPWPHVHVFWGDERYVPHDDPRSNYRMATEALLDHVPCPASNIHHMPTHFSSADAAARDYEQTLRSHFAGDWPNFDLVLLGLGDDGHTASLFPGSLALAERARWVVPAEVQAEPRLRLTLTLPALRAATVIHVLAAGSNKAHALQHVLGGAVDWMQYPAAAIRLASGTVIWWADRQAAALVADK